MSSETGPSTPGSSRRSGFVPLGVDDLDAIFGNYEFIDLLGRGGMGAVYKARQKSLDRLVAIKILPPSLVQDGEETSFHFAERFQREARAMAKLSHPNIIAVYDFGQASDGQYYFVMEYIEGTDLHALIQGGQLTPEHVAGWISQICDALQYAHAKGIVHRDIKPANIMITLEGQVKVADFGLAKLTGAGEVESKLTMTNMAMGTPDYVAPEALEMGVEVDHRADLYAVGVMIYEMLTGKVPRGAWKSPSTQIPGLDPRYDKLIERAMDADREERHQQASEISATIYEIATTPAKPVGGRRTLLVGEAAGTGPVKPSVSPPSPGPEIPPGHGESSSLAPAHAKRKSKGRGGLIAVSALAAAGLGLVLFFVNNPESDAPPNFADFKPETVIPAAAAPQPKTPDREETQSSTAPSKTPSVSSPVTPSVPETATSPSFPETIDTTPWTDAISLLPIVDVSKDAGKNAWVVEGTVFISDAKHQPALLEIPVIAPEEYDLRIRFTKHEGSEVIGVILSRGDHSFVWKGGGFGNTTFGFGHFQGEKSFHTRNDNLTKVASCFKGGFTHTAQITVRKTGAAAYLDGVKVSQLPADLAEMRTPEDWKLQTQGALGLGTFQTKYAVHSVEIRAITGEAKLLRETPAPATAPALTTAIPESVTPPPAPIDPVSQKLIELEKTFLTAYETQVSPKHDADVADLNSKYAAALNRAITAASQAGKLDEALALREEKSQIETHGTVPAEDAADLPAVLAPLRSTYRTTLSTLLANRDQLAAPLHTAYDRALATYQDELTRAQKLDEATRVKAVRNHAASRRETKPDPTEEERSTTASSPPIGQKITPLPPPPVAPPLSADQILPPLPKPSSEDVQTLVAWILNDPSNAVTLAEGPSEREIKKGEPLPRGNLKVVGIYIYAFPNDEPSRKFLDLLGSLPDLESLHIKRHEGVFPVASLRGLTKLKSLTLGLGQFDDSGFPHLSGLTALTDVTFASIKGYSGTGLGYLGEGITHLNLTGNTNFTVEGFAHLTRFRKLKWLQLYESPNLTDEMLKVLAAFPELETLEVRDTPVDGSFLSFLPDNSKLKVLDLSATENFQPQHLTHLDRLKLLETLLLPPLDPPSEVMTSIATLGNLKEIHFSTPFSGETLAGVKVFRILEKVYIDNCPITDAGWAAIAESMPNLRSLDYKRFADAKGPVSAAAMGEHLGKLRFLTSVAAMHNGITDEWMPAIAKLKSVRWLSLQGAGLTDAGLVALQDMEITHLIIRQTGLTDAAVPTLKRFPALRTGEFHQTKITDPVRAEFSEFLKARAE